MVPPTDDPWMVGWHASMVGSNNIEPCHYAGEFITRVTRCSMPTSARVARCPGQDGVAQAILARRGFAGMAGGHHKAMVMVAHEGSGAASIEWFDQWITTGNPAIKRRIIAYNEDDCRATRVLLDGIRGLNER
jgi:hypothetical protein